MRSPLIDPTNGYVSAVLLTEKRPKFRVRAAPSRSTTEAESLSCDDRDGGGGGVHASIDRQTDRHWRIIMLESGP